MATTTSLSFESQRFQQPSSPIRPQNLRQDLRQDSPRTVVVDLHRRVDPHHQRHIKAAAIRLIAEKASDDSGTHNCNFLTVQQGPVSLPA
jgi:hypothetical protein